MSNREITSKQIAPRDSAAWIFAIFFVVGSSLIAISKSWDLSLLTLIFIPIVVLILYVLTVWYVPAFKIRRDQIGDNAYYLGFLLTLVSLSVTLAQYSDDSSGDYIVANFGVALAATVAGIFLRSMINQMRRDISDSEEDMRRSLQEAATKLRSQSYFAAESFAMMNKQINQVTRESSVDIANANNELAKSLNNIIEQRVSAVEAQLETSKAELEKQMELNSTAVRAQCDEAVSTLKDTVRDFIPLIEEQQLMFLESADNARKAIESFNDIKIETSVISELNNNMSMLCDKIYDEMTKLGAQAIDNSKVFDEIVSSNHGSLEKISNEMDKFGSKAIENSRVFDEAAKQNNENLEKISDSSKKHQATIDTELELVEQMHKKLNSILEDISGLGTNISKFEGSVEKIGKQIAKLKN